LWWAAAAGLFCVIAYVLGPPDIVTGYKSAYWQERQILYGAVAVALLIPLAFGNQAVGGVRRFLRWKPVWWVGVVSYGFYLWHLDWMNRVVNRQTVFATHPGWHGWAGTPSGNSNFLLLVAVGVVAALICAAISWYAMEKPLLRLKGLVGGKRALKPSERPEPVSVG
jgi:peptidoglycan/LPS O-acetylase OafA/YrhL